YIETGRYLEKIFPSMGIRFLAINDHYDSADENREGDNIIIPFKNLINDAYCRDISMKIRSQLDVKRKNGKFIGSFAGYGYKKDPADRNHLLVDEEAAEVIRQIFNWKLDGMSPQNISAKLDEMSALPPMEYKRRSGLNFNSGFRSGQDEKWSPVAVLRILKNELYTGVMVQGKHKKINYKVKQSLDIDEEEWIRVAGTHEAIIPRNIFDQVQKLLEIDTRTAPDEETVYLFSGFVRCGTCGQNMVRRCSRKGGKKYNYYHCSTYKNGNGCTSHNISEKKLTEAVISAVRSQAEVLVKADRLMKELGRFPAASEARKIDGQIMQLEKEADRYQGLKENLYEDMKDGLISREEFQSMRGNFSKRVRDAQEKIRKLEKKREEILEKQKKPYPWLDEFCKYKEITYLDRKALNTLVESVTVYSADRIEIQFRYGDEMESLLQVFEEYGMDTDEGTEAIL
ncbi:MAG: recombinase family protein, partial [Clostridiales bacterium]|nr:recombinase family protein [Clostridiales bacterium]